jgi:NAD(P)-dependent dehydrogenase (short-subunit alcohol dehydrogenase family)
MLFFCFYLLLNPKMSGLLQFLAQAWSPPADRWQQLLCKEPIVVAGDNSGLGFKATLELHQLNCSLLILRVCDISKGETAMEDIVKRVVQGKNGEGRGRIEVWKCELGDHDHLLDFVKKVNGVMLNAGIFGLSNKLGRYSWEEVLQIKVLSMALLGMLLLLNLKASRREGERLPVFNFVSSGGHQLVTSPRGKEQGRKSVENIQRSRIL